MGWSSVSGARDIVRLLMSVVFHDLAGACRVPEDPIAHSELAALTRRFEEVAERTDREFGIVKSDLTAVRLQIGNLDQKVEALDKKIDRNQAQIIELLTQLVGQRPDAG
jgi:peptidoglycan hydrolase CwlO-like protein